MVGKIIGFSRWLMYVYADVNKDPVIIIDGLTKNFRVCFLICKHCVTLNVRLCLVYSFLGGASAGSWVPSPSWTLCEIVAHF